MTPEEIVKSFYKAKALLAQDRLEKCIWELFRLLRFVKKYLFASEAEDQLYGVSARLYRAEKAYLESKIKYSERDVIRSQIVAHLLTIIGSIIQDYLEESGHKNLLMDEPRINFFEGPKLGFKNALENFVRMLE